MLEEQMVVNIILCMVLGINLEYHLDDEEITLR